MIQALHASIWYYKQMNRLSSILQLHCLGSREPQVQRSHAINVFFLVSATYTQLHVIKLSYFCTSYIMTNWCRPTCIHKKHSYRRETATPHFRPIFNPPLGLGVKKASSSLFESAKKILFSVGRCLLVIFPVYGVGKNATIRSSIAAPEVVRHDVKHEWFFWNWRNFMVMLTTMIKQIRNKYCCNSSDKV